jgi:hypothetical protein
MNYSSILKEGEGSRRKIDSIINHYMQLGDVK